MIRSTAAGLSLERQWLVRLIDETNALRVRAEYRAWLTATLYQWRYSPMNVTLIAMQRPGTTHVASASDWKRRGRPLKSDAQPIWVLAPTSARSFIGVPIFAADDTVGPPLTRPSWSVVGRARWLPALEVATARLGVTVEAGPVPRGAIGVALPGGRIRLRRDVSEAEQAVTLVHELAHSLLGHLDERQELDERQREAEAEAVSWVVSKRLGLATRAPEYLVAAGVQVEHLKRSTRRIGGAARRVLSALEPSRSRRGDPTSRVRPTGQGTTGEQTASEASNGVAR
ncbi:MAG: ImmA/IrrE family metallo-endopeptidase [Myxococcaceae bacterium]|jgi:hypothetical protein|nr:ImmA/IrrE family metallo-endopeptidase [Myxococcaceae bacterium]MCA3011006.1 ImmA/IrrE family metallo-endopeptidase [Myxococcaceae bacterium]